VALLHAFSCIPKMKIWHKFHGTPTKVVLEQHTTGIERHSSGKEGDEEFPNPLAK
jgi:hypothetical protein